MASLFGVLSSILIHISIDSIMIVNFFEKYVKVQRMSRMMMMMMVTLVTMMSIIMMRMTAKSVHVYVRPKMKPPFCSV